MRSAYMVLGVPGDASLEEIEAAFRRAERLYPRERLAQEEGALARLGELKSAYQVLRDPGSRAAHDRKLEQAVRPASQPRTVIVHQVDESPGRRMMVSAFWLVGILLVAGAGMTWRNAEARKDQAAQELAAQKAAEQVVVRQREEQERLAAHRAAQAAEAQANDNRMAYEARISMARATADMRAQEANLANARRAEQAQEQNRQYEERRAAAEARARVERDKQRVREICYQVYRRPDC